MYPNKLWQLHCSFKIEKPNTNITSLFRFLSTWTSRTVWDWATLLRARSQWPRFLSLGLLLLYSEPATWPPGHPSDPLDVIITAIPWHQRHWCHHTTLKVLLPLGQKLNHKDMFLVPGIGNLKGYRGDKRSPKILESLWFFYKSWYKYWLCFASHHILLVPSWRQCLLP